MIDSNWLHPMRFQRSRPFAHRLFQAYERTAGRVAEVGIETITAVQSIPFDAFNALPDAVRARSSRALDRDLSGILSQESSLGLHVARYRALGRNLFLLEPALMNLLDRTDLDGVRFSDLRFPFPAFYVAFGNAFDGSLSGASNQIDGAYISTFRENIEVVVTSRRLDISHDAKFWPSNRDRYFYIPLDFTDAPERTLSEALGRAVRDKLIPLEPRPLDDISFSEAAAMAMPEGTSPPGIIDGRERSRHIDSESARQGYDPARRALALVVNALCWLAAFRGDERPTRTLWPSDAPEDLMALLASSRPAHRQRGHSELTKRAFSQIVLCQGPAAVRAVGAEAQERTGTVAPHWRRGHWRRQPFGPGRAEVRLSWVRPTFVGGIQRAAEASGHVYRMTPDRTEL